jgi:hypothetical protein
MLRGKTVNTRALIVVGIVIVGAGAAHAQEFPPVVTPPPAPPQAAVPAVTEPAPAAAPAPIDVARRREQIGLMEGLLAAAVRNGAQETARQIQSVQPGLSLFTGVARARGFFLEGYGVFFHVEIPGVQPSVDWIVDAIERSRAARQDGQASLAGTNPRPRGMFDANAAYTEAVQQKLIDAMIDLRIDLQPDEWLTVAARDGVGPVPGQIEESITIVLRVRGSDLSDFLAGKITRAEVRQKVQVREF